MKFKKLGLLFASVPLLVSCAPKSIAGTYGFQLGKETGTHFGMFMHLSDTPFQPDPEDATVYEEGLKKFEFTISVNMSKDDEQSSSAIDSILDYFKDEDGNASIPGYYKLVDETNPKGERRVKLGISFKYIVDKAAAITKEETGEDVDTSTFNDLNDSKIIQNLLCATYKDNTFNVYIPVSVQDLYYQLYWYGTDLKIKFDPAAEDIADILSFDIVETEAHPFGTLPTKAQIDKINETFKAEHESCMFTEYKLFHQIKLGLTKK